MLLIILLIIILIIIFASIIENKNDKVKLLKLENDRLKKRIIELQQYIDNSGENIEAGKVIELKTEVKKETINIQLPELAKELSPEEREKKRLQKEKEEREKKNTTILVTGAILIVLAAIVFLMSTWNSIANLAKTTILVLLIGVFLGIHKIAKDKFNLEKVSDTFFYIAMAYIPICLVSISVFKLFGNYLSIDGNGKYIYFSISAIIISVIYYFSYKIKQKENMIYGSILAQAFSIILFSLIFSNNIIFVGINLLLYNILFIILTTKHFEKLHQIIPFMVAFITLLKIGNSDGLIAINLLLLAINFFILEIKKSSLIKSLAFNICVMGFGLYSINLCGINFSKDIKLLLNIIYSILVYVCIYGYCKIKENNKNLKTSITIISFITISILHLYSIEEYLNYIKPYTISVVQLILLLITYFDIKNSIDKKIISYLISTYWVAIGIQFILEFNGSYHYYILFAMFTFVIGELLDKFKLKRLNKSFFNISHILLFITYSLIFIIEESDFVNDLIYFILLELIYLYSYFKRTNCLFKYLAYIIENIVLLSGCICLDLSDKIMALIPAITTLEIIVLENKNINLQDNFSKVYIGISEVVSYLALTTLTGITESIISISFSAYLIYKNINNKEESWLTIIPLIGMMPSIFLNYMDKPIKVSIMIIITSLLTVLSIKNKRVNLYTLFAGIYLLLTMNKINEIYVNELLFITWLLIHLYFIEARKEKDFFKVLTYFGRINYL